eukprot:4834997-Pyramimonas_sp.AAC.1
MTEVGLLALVPFAHDPEHRLDRISAARVKQISKSYKSTSLNVYLYDMVISSVFQPPKYRAMPIPSAVSESAEDVHLKDLQEAFGIKGEEAHEWVADGVLSG